ncbi:MAG: sigma-70 family RNA polymerase sigma factor [Elusimicrobiota bacterium]
MSFEELYDKYFSRVYNYIRYRVIAPDMADDIVSLVFEKVLDKYAAFDPAKANIEVWLFTIARNTLMDHYRRAKIRGCLSISDMEETIQSPESVEKEVETKDLGERVLKAVARLSDKEREIIVLKFTMDMTNRDIAETMGLSESNIGVILFRAMKQLKELMRTEAI